MYMGHGYTSMEPPCCASTVAQNVKPLTFFFTIGSVNPEAISHTALLKVFNGT